MNRYKSLPMHTTPDAKFAFGFIRSPRDLAGRKTPFRQGWHVERLANGETSFEGSRKAVFQWIAEWYDIADTPHPDWLTKEIGEVAR